MDEKLKYRLVGASVILALAVFFLPMILDSEKYRSQLQSQIPEAPNSSRSESTEDSLQSEPSSFKATGPVEQGPLVINLDDSVEQEQTVASKNNSNAKPQHSPETEEAETQKDRNQKASKQAEQKSQQEQSDLTKEVVSSTKATTNQGEKEVAQEDTKPKSQAKPKSETQSEPESKPQSKSQTEQSIESEIAFSDSAWLIQIGSFSNKENATRLVNQLRDEGYRAYQRVGDSYARVYVGPYPVKGEAETRTSALEKIIGSKVKVIEFDPKQH